MVLKSFNYLYDPMRIFKQPILKNMYNKRLNIYRVCREAWLKDYRASNRTINGSSPT